jgi:hypothetical protein
MTIVLSEGRRIARKPHKCFECYRTIAPGTEYGFQTCKYDYVYTLAWHLDCHAMSQEWRDLTDEYCDEDGYCPLRDALCESGDYLAALDDFRGDYPHVVCRMELTDQLWEARE